MIKKRMAAILLALVMLISLLPGMALAASDYTVSLSASAAEVKAGENVSISIDVTSNTETSYNAFYTTLTYDSAKFSYTGGNTVNGFAVDSATAGTLKISKVGEDIAISSNPDLALDFGYSHQQQPRPCVGF